jgi:hypothetical protein
MKPAGGGGEALPGKEKTAVKGDILTAVFLLIVIFNQFPLHPLTLRLIGRWRFKTKSMV